MADGNENHVFLGVIVFKTVFICFCIEISGLCSSNSL